mgnify:CR=1 FL=1
MRAKINPLFTGLLLGLLQWSSFLQVQALVAATAGIYSACLAAWLTGSLVGLAWGRRGPEGAWLGGAVLAYVALFGLTRAGTNLPAAAPIALAAVMGTYAGCFFRRRGDAPGCIPRHLLALEGAGATAGLALAAAGAAMGGETFLLAGPVMAAVPCALTLPRQPPVQRPQKFKSAA